MTISTLLNRISSFFFACGFVFSKCVYLPPVLLGASFRVLGLVSYLLAYVLWIMRTHVDPDVEKQEDQWYGFMPIQGQIRLGAYINAAATLLSFGVFFFPIVIVPASWLFLVGNIIWAIGEYHKLYNPLDEPDNSFIQQQAFVNYAILVCVITLLSAISATVCFIFPAMLMPILLCSALVSTGVAGVAFSYWLESCPNPFETIPTPNSYNNMNPLLDSSSDSKSLVEIPKYDQTSRPLFSAPPKSVETSVNEESQTPTPTLMAS